MAEKRKENEYLQGLIELEDLAEKKSLIYARLLMDSSLAKEMEGLASRHSERRARIEKLLHGEAKEGGRYETNAKKEEK